MYCLICHEKIIFHHTWDSIFRPLARICEACSNELQPIGIIFCLNCGRLQKEQTICNDCLQWKNTPRFETSLAYNRALFTYNDKMKEIIYRWKYRGDYELVELFSPYILKKFSTFYSINKATLVPIPLSPERLEERRFNQAEAITNIIQEHFRLPVVHALTRKSEHAEKQSKRSKKQRIQAKNPFKLKKSLNMPIILVDDIYTTGTTIHHAAKLFKDAGCPIVYSFTLIR